jgi:NAD(P)H dehydrogenase (quinone)
MTHDVIVTGATGNLGKRVLAFLLEKLPASQLAALVRSEDKARELGEQGITILPGNYNDHASLVNAFREVDKLYLVPGVEVGNRLQQQLNVVNAAREAGVRHLFFVSFQRSTEDPNAPGSILARDYIGTEQAIKKSGMVFTILKHPLYMEGILPLCEKALKTGTLYTPAGEGRISFAARTDLAEAGAFVLTSFGHENETYEFGGPKSYSYREIAEILSGLSGKKINYVSPNPDEYQREQLKAGIPVERSKFGVIFGNAIQRGEFNHPDTTLQEFLRHEPLQPYDVLKTAFGM